MPEYYRAAGVSDFSEGLVRVFKVNEVDIAIVNHEGAFYAFSGRCPHAGYYFNYTRVKAEDRIVCSSHMALFDLKSGQVLGGPTNTSLCVYPVKVEGDDVLVSTEPAG
jgi:3-phenylpropionate/trans-cinnamate dioxygenase ferredoxin subunit